MTALLPALAAMTAVAVAAVLWPLFRRRPAPARSSFELGVYRDQLAEIERDLARGLVAPEEAGAARLEIERRILRSAAAAAADPAEAATDQRSGPVLAAALLVPLLTLGLYAALGAPELPDRPLAARQDRETDAPGQPDVAAMVAQLEARLAGAPDDLEGWLMLGRSRAVLGQAPGAVEAYRRAKALAPADPRAMAALGESLVDAAGGVVTPEARGLFAQLETQAPEDPRSGFYLGWAEAQAGDYRAALERWRVLLAAAPADAPWRERVVEAVRAAAGELQLDAEAVLAQVPAPPAASAASPPAPSEEEVAQAGAMAPEERQAFIRGMVDKLQARLDADGSDVEGWLRLAQSRLVLNEPERARAAFERGLALHPDDPSLLKGFAASLLGPARADTGLPEIGDRAAELYGKVASVTPDDPEPWWYLGVRALQEGRRDEARSSWGKVLTRLDPKRPEYAAIKQRLDQLGG